MSTRIIGQVSRVNGPVIIAQGVTDAMMMELVQVSDEKLIGEVIKLEGTTALIQVYEDTTMVTPGDNIYGSGMPLSVEVGPGLIGTIYDGIQRPLEDLYRQSGHFIGRGLVVNPLSREKVWHFVPADIAIGTELKGGCVLGTVQETREFYTKFYCLQT